MNKLPDGYNTEQRQQPDFIGKHIYFGNGPVECIGTITGAGEGYVIADMRELGVTHRFTKQKITQLAGIRVVDEAEFARLAARDMSKREFDVIFKEWAGIKPEIERLRLREKELEELMDASPWVVCPESGKIMEKGKSESARPAR